MTYYAVYLKIDGGDYKFFEDEFSIQDEFNIQDGENTIVRMLKLFAQKTEAYKYINYFNYDDKDVEVREVTLKEV